MKGLILSGRADLSLDREVSEEGFNFWSIHFVGMTFVVEENKPPDPLNISFFGAVGVMLETNSISNLVEELFGWRLHERYT
jgi:hypothetical protein